MVYGGGIRYPLDVIYFNAILYNPEEMPSPDACVLSVFGPPILKTEVFKFSHTDYYKKEMGENLCKYLVGYNLIESPNKLALYKRITIDIEMLHCRLGKRLLNIDVGYVAHEKVVLASTKNFTHRVYIDNGIYGDVQLMRRKNAYEYLDWTYADYKYGFVAQFFENMRSLVL